MNSEEKARELSQKYGACFDDCCADEVHDAVMEMAKWKEEQFRNLVKDYIELAYNSGQEANLLEDLLTDINE